MHEYTAREALELLLKKVKAVDIDLTEQLHRAIDSGKDVEEEEAPIGRQKTGRRYRRSVPLTEEEALSVALDVLQAYFVEQPRFVSSALRNFRGASADGPISRRSVMTIADRADDTARRDTGNEKVLEVEPHAETQITRPGDQMLRLKSASEKSVKEQMRNLGVLRRLIDFKGERSDGDAG